MTRMRPIKRMEGFIFTTLEEAQDWVNRKAYELGDSLLTIHVKPIAIHGEFDYQGVTVRGLLYHGSVIYLVDNKNE
jgi:hypothetical protein